MKLNKNLLALATATAFGLSGQAFAAGTTAGFDISNTVSLGYSVNSTAQTAVESVATFKVDHKVDMTLSSDTASADTAPGETVTLAYTITNTGNKAQAYALELSHLTDTDHSPQTVTFHSATPTTAGNQLSNSKLAAIAVDTPTTIYASVEVTQNTNIGNGDTVQMLLTATALDASDTDGTTYLEQDVLVTDDKNANLTTEYVVFAEAATTNDVKQSGEITAQTDRAIVTAEFTDPADANAVPTLAVKIINDIICDSGLTDASTADYSIGATDAGNCPNASAPAYAPKAIPTSMAQFTYSAENTGAVTANSVVFTETLEAEYAIDSLAQATLSIDGVDQVLTTVTVTPANDNEVQLDDTTGKITLNIGDVAKDEVVVITYTAIVE